jgi:hypothetical protein
MRFILLNPLEDCLFLEIEISNQLITLSRFIKLLMFHNVKQKLQTRFFQLSVLCFQLFY